MEEKEIAQRQRGRENTLIYLFTSQMPNKAMAMPDQAEARNSTWVSQVGGKDSLPQLSLPPIQEHTLAGSWKWKM